MDTAKTNDFAVGSVAGHMVRQSVPLLIAEFTNALYNIVDRIYIGHIQDVDGHAITGMGLVFPVITVINAVTMLFRSGGAPLCSIARGRGETESAERIMTQTMIWLLAAAVLVTGIGYMTEKPLLYLLGASENTFPYADAYFKIYLPGTIFSMFSVGMNSFINLQGFPKTGMVTIIAGAVSNLILDPILIFGAGMGIQGAALATVISQGISALWVLWFFLGRKGVLRVRRKYFRVDWKLTRDILGLGFSGFVMRGTNGIITAVTNLAVKRYGGDIYIGAMTIALTLQEVLFLFISAVAEGTSPVLGYNYGAKEYRRVKEGIRWLNNILMIYSCSVTVVLMVFAAPIAGFFTNNQQLRETTAVGIRYYFFLFCTSGLMSTGQRVFQALGMAKKAAFFAFFRKMVLMLPMLFLLPLIPGLGVNGIFMANNLSEAIAGIICYATMRAVVRKKLQ